MRETHPVGIDQSGGTAKILDETIRTVEVERKNLDLIAERVFTVDVVGQSADCVSAGEQKARRIFAGATEGTGDDDGRVIGEW